MSQADLVADPVLDVAPAARDAAPGLLHVEGVEKTFGLGMVTALTGIDLRVADHEFFTLLGPSGCGKTTLLRIIAGFEHPTRGRVLLGGRDIAHDPPHRRPVNTMFQSYALFPHLTVAANVAFGLERLRWARPAIAARVDEVLGLVQLGHLKQRRPAELSGGQQQRVALARALAPKPRLLLLDEPLSALDLKLRRSMQLELKRLQRETGVTFILVTHDQEEALALSDRIAVMNRGEVLQVGSPDDIYEQPRTAFVADFIGEANLLPAALWSRPDGIVAVRPERVFLHPAGRLPDGCRGLSGRVLSVTYLGADALVEVSVADERPLRARLRDVRQRPEPGSEVGAAWRIEHERTLAA